MPALISDWAPMIERVRPAQLTTTVVSGSGAMSKMRSASSAPGTSMPPGMFMALNSLIGRLSTMARSSPRSFMACSSAAGIWGVSYQSSMHSPNAFDGTLTPVKTSNPAPAQASSPPFR